MSEVHTVVCKPKIPSNSETPWSTRERTKEAFTKALAKVTVTKMQTYSHPEQWQNDFSSSSCSYTTISLSSCVCRADQVSISRHARSVHPDFLINLVFVNAAVDEGLIVCAGLTRLACKIGSSRFSNQSCFCKCWRSHYVVYTYSVAAIVSMLLIV